MSSPKVKKPVKKTVKTPTAAAAIASVARSKGVNPLTALADASYESTHGSGLNPRAVGDQGTSFGAFQLHEGGELGSLTRAQAFNATTNATRALSQFAQVQKQYGKAIKSPGELAFLAQRPAGYSAANPLGSTTTAAAQTYIAGVNKTYNALKSGQLKLAGVSVKSGKVSAATGPTKVGSTNSGKSPAEQSIFGQFAEAVGNYLAGHPKAGLTGALGPAAGKVATTAVTTVTTTAAKGAGTLAGDTIGAGITAGVSAASQGILSFFETMFQNDPTVPIAAGGALVLAVLLAKPKITRDTLSAPAFSLPAASQPAAPSVAAPAPSSPASPGSGASAGASPAPAPAPLSPTSAPAYAPAVAALRSLGYRKSDAEHAVGSTVKPEHSTEDAVSAALASLDRPERPRRPKVLPARPPASPATARSSPHDRAA